MEKNSSTVQAFGTLLAALCAAFRVEPSEALTEGYWMALEDLSVESVAAAVRSAIRTCDRMPTGSELRRLTGEMATGTRAVHAWGAVARAIGQHGGYRSVDFDDPVINATIRNLGGWQKLCALDVDEAKWTRKDFERIYSALCASGVSPESAQYLPGIHEQNNQTKGRQIAPPTRVVTGLPPHCEGVVRGELSAGASRSEASGLMVQIDARRLMPPGARVVAPPAFDEEAAE